MNVKITANTCTIDNNVYLNAGEYNINKFYFTFSDEYLDEYVKKALFIDKDGTPIEMVIANNKCDIPYDILKNPGTYTFGVYAYEMDENHKLILRYSPEPTHFYVNKGSYIEGGTSPTDPTPDEFAQYYQAMQDLIANAKPELIDYIDDNLPTIDVRETTTLAPGTPATVTNVGTERNPIFDFGIPQGAPGTTDYNELVNKPDLTVFALVTESANKIALEMDPTEFKIKAKIFDKNNRLISESNVIDLPLESVVVSGEYDAANKKIILTLENGNVIEIPVEDLIDGLATKTELEEGLATKDANIIESISKNGSPLPVNANKNVNITVPTKTSEVINDSGFITNDTNGLSHYYNKTAADTRFSLVTETGSNFILSIDPTTFVMTATLKDKNGRALSTQTVDLPLESVVVGGRYDSETREVVLTLENGSVVRFSVADLVSGLQSEITDSNKLSSDLVDDTNSVNKFVTAEEKTQIATNESDISDIKDEQEIQNDHLDELDMIYNAFPTVSDENETIQLDNTAKVKFREIDLKGNTSQVVIPEEQGTSVSNTSIYVSDVDTDKENTIEMSGNTYQETTTGKNLLNTNNIATGTLSGITTSYNAETQEITLNGTCTTDNTQIVISTNAIDFTSGVTKMIAYYVSGSVDVSSTTDNRLLFRTFRGGGQWDLYAGVNIATLSSSNPIISITGGSTGTKSRTDLRIDKNTALTNFKIKVMITDSNDTTYEPYTYGASPNPDYPQNIEVVTGTQNVEVCGKNLFDKSKAVLGKRLDPTGYYYNDADYYASPYIRVTPNIKYIKNSPSQDAYHRYCFYTKDKTFINQSTYNVYTIPSNCWYVRFCGLQSELDTTQFEQGDTSTTYEAYTGTTYPVNLGNIELCKIDTYKDRIYKKNDKWYLEKKIGKVVLTGDSSESYSLSSNTNVIYYQSTINVGNSSNILSNYYFYSSFINLYNATVDYAISYNTSNNLLAIRNKNMSSANDFKTWLSTHNTIVYYPLETPTTTEITDTTLVSQLNALYNATIYPITNINTNTSNLLPYIDLHYNFVTPSPSPSRPSQVNVVKGDNTITISNSDNTESQVFPINLGDMELCKIGTYQDYIYESNGNWFKKSNIGKTIINGTETTIIMDERPAGLTYYSCNIYNNNFAKPSSICYCNKLLYSENSLYSNDIQGIKPTSSGRIKIKVFDSSLSTDSLYRDWLSENNLLVYYVLNTPTDTQITDNTLITQLNNIKKAYSYDTQTNISQTNADKPFIIYAEAIDNNADLLTDYVKNTDYATADKGGVVKVTENYAVSIGNTGNIFAVVRTYSQYQSMYDYMFIGKGTLENVIEGKGLVSNTDYATANKGGVIKANDYYNYVISATSGSLYTRARTYQEYTKLDANAFIGKGTLENVITGKDLTTKAYVDGLVGDVESLLETLDVGSGV